ncbi:MAG TPA: chemotaxis protein CheA [Gemmatimonadales bacterium]|nr:chemotaxis protein CheA [Gemmatimonadales bacterium]
MDVRQYADLFLTESREHLSAYNQLLLELEKDPSRAEAVDGIFRAVHTIKGMAAAMGYSAVAEVAHRAENLLDAIRKGEKVPTTAILDLLFRSADALEQGVAAAVAGKEFEAEELLEELDKAVVGKKKGKKKRKGDGGDRGERSELVAAPPSGEGRVVAVVLRADAPIKGARAVLVLKRAEALGVVSGVTPPPAQFEAAGFDGRFSFRLLTEADAADIERELKLAGDVDTVEVQGVRAPAAAAAVAEAPRPGAAGTAAGTRHIRVDLRRLDALMNLIGELSIARERLQLLVSGREDQDLDEVTVRIGRLTRALQSEIVQARMTPVWQVFDRFPRTVRDLARQMGKQVDFAVEGKDIELDRAILDEIGEPLVHLLRNAVDHGIETPEERVRQGKQPAGKLVLAAVRERSTVAIRVSDDGRGVNRARVLAKAKEQGLVDESVENLPDEELFRLLTRAGFSTAGEVTELSGRGVGIDVVATAARALGGSLEIRSEEGRGSTFTVRLPITLAIVRALLADVGGETYAMPLTHVAETVDPRSEDVQLVQGKEAILLRGRLVPLLRLRELLGAEQARSSGTWTVTGGSRLPVIVLEVGERRTGVVVDRLLGQQEIVVKSFDAPRGMLPVFSGATILGDGRPALILDAGGLA